ncbi:TetR/AcrR family transcriptional regulator [Pseudonocardia humida]|uniref:TetR/AcrR family transcriptional regulator n=1 Tax=Pseudonocardia humida TaxID=2800819 RepID=A0ABT1A4S9_9PSEU|nr:TetR/AcrR family transcriptional regulator [Pseudonocardia humida]MCO1657990.1 TetR/AcrR family transcriptional regulator [Pseudonocardia humida]
MNAQTTGGDPSDVPPRVRRLRRAERREQILGSATRAFARGGFTATGLDDVAREAGVTRDLLYRHFDSKADLYRAVLERACRRVDARVGADDFDDDAIPALVAAAAADPDGFRLVFRHASREPEFRDLTDGLAALSVDIARRNLARHLPDGPWLDWAARLIPTLATESVITWLDAGRPDPEHAPARISQAIHGVIAAAASPAPLRTSDSDDLPA